MNLYCRIPFGRQHSRAMEVIELAQVLGRTPGSVAMKLNNLTSLDPEEKARGVAGLPGASQLDRQVWDEFHTNWEGMAAESEFLWEKTIRHHEVLPSEEDAGAAKKARPLPEALPDNLPTGPTESERTVKVRLAQVFFRRTVLAAYHGRCCISGNPVPELLIASHILPWAGFAEHRANPSNGLCLSRLHDAAFDQGLIAFDESKRLVLSKRLRDYLPNEAIRVNFSSYEGSALRLPEKFFPEERFLAHHREHIFIDR
jgi:putative restriction endonuclease